MSIHDNVFNLLSEMAEPSGPILSWESQIYIKEILKRKDLSVEQMGKAIAKKLHKHIYWTWDELTTSFEQVKTQEALDSFLALMYEECDHKRILVK